MKTPQRVIKQGFVTRVIGKCMFNEWERKDFRSAEKITTAGRNKEKTSFWHVDDFSARGPVKSLLTDPGL